MKIKIAVISSEHISKAEDLSVKLLNAMENGEMKAVDQTTEELLLLTDKDFSLSLSEEYWHRLIEDVRRLDGNFKSDYLMDISQLETIIASGVTKSLADLASVVELALKTDGVLLQLPFEEEDDNV